MSDCQFGSRTRTDSSGTGTSTPSSTSDYINGEGDDSSDSRGTVPCTLKSVENLLSLSKVRIKNFKNLENIYKIF